MIATVAVVLPTPLPVAAITTRGMLNDVLTDAHPTMRDEPIASLTIGSHTGTVLHHVGFLCGLFHRLRLELEALTARIDDHLLTVAHFARDQLAAQRGFQLPLNHPPQRTRAVRRVVAVL